MKEYTTAKYLTKTIHQLEHILADETFPAIQAADRLTATLRELMHVLPEPEQEQIKEIITLYQECAEKQYGPLYQRNHTQLCR